MEAPELEAAATRLRAAGLRMTEGRRQLLGLFAGLGRWCTPQELYGAAEQAGLHPGLATVYRLIEALVETGLCKPFIQRDRTVRYVFCPPRHHHHLICEACGRVADLAECRLVLPSSEFAIREHAVDFFGLCGACRAVPAP